MRRIIIRNLRSKKSNKPRIFDALIDGDRVYFEIKTGSCASEVIELNDVIEQIAAKEIHIKPPLCEYLCHHSPGT